MNKYKVRSALINDMLDSAPATELFVEQFYFYHLSLLFRVYASVRVIAPDLKMNHILIKSALIIRV